MIDINGIVIERKKDDAGHVYYSVFAPDGFMEACTLENAIGIAEELSFASKD